MSSVESHDLAAERLIRVRRRDAWRAQVADAVPGTAIHASAAFEGGTLRATQLGRMRVQHVEASPHRVEHRPTAQLANHVAVLVALRGGVELRQDGRCCTLAPGQLVLSSSDRPLSARFTTAYEIVFVLVPATDLAHVPRHAFGRPTSTEDPADRLLFDYVAALPTAARAMVSAQHRAALAALAALIELCTAAHAPAPAGASRLDQALCYLDTHLADPELTADQVAAAQRVSRRFLDELFRSVGATIERTIWERRLQRAAASLSDPGAQHVSVHRISLGCGFRSASHFGRRFRARFGVTPAQWRLGLRRCPPGGRRSSARGR